jgi:hypothetical protein
MNYFTVFAITLSVLSQAPSSLAADAKIPIFTATSDAFDGNLEIALTVDQNSDASGLIYTKSGTDTALALSDLPKGIVIYQSGGKDVITLSSLNFNVKTGGALILTYLQNGVSDVYQNFDFSIGRQGQNWTPYISDTNGIPQSFVSMYLKAKKLFGKVIGIDSITVQ